MKLEELKKFIERQMIIASNPTEVLYDRIAELFENSEAVGIIAGRWEPIELARKKLKIRAVLSGSVLKLNLIDSAMQSYTFEFNKKVNFADIDDITLYYAGMYDFQFKKISFENGSVMFRFFVGLLLASPNGNEMDYPDIGKTDGSVIIPENIFTILDDLVDSKVLYIISPSIDVNPNLFGFVSKLCGEKIKSIFDDNLIEILRGNEHETQ